MGGRRDDPGLRVGGVERMRFGPKSRPDLMSEGRFLDIVMGERIVSAGTMHRDNIRISATLCTVELTEDVSGGTQVKLTDQSAYLDGSEKPKDRQSGWGKIFEHLGKHLSAGATGDRTKMEGL
ncbi:SRPBCC domain-containing protein [Variovorax sp. PBS-H4]|uniref:SRPBCC domain-containing protein n=1 Tax=Variovorax sp. PBS-H4 TaxID=434008 RepID=UPI002F968145